MDNYQRYQSYRGSNDRILACTDHSFYYFRHGETKVASFFGFNIVRFFGGAFLPSAA